MASASAAIVLRHIRQWAGGPNAAQLADQQLLQRFVTQREEAAFSALVERHGPMVLRVCQRVLQDRHAAEDAFQATFLVLVRKAGAIRKRQLLANWLYGVAYRIAIRAKVDAAKRRNREERGEPKSPTDPVAEVTGRELCALLDEELNRLPERYRAPFQLCYLEGLTRDQVAQQLGWSLRTLQRRLEQGRRLLQSRLTRRGVTLSAALLAAGLSKQTASAAVPPLLVISTVKAASVFAAGEGVAAAGISAQVVALAEEILRGLAAAKVKVVIMLVLAVGAITSGAGLLARQAVGPKPEQPTAQQRPPVAKGFDQPRPQGQKQGAQSDAHRDPLPDGAVAPLHAAHACAGAHRSKILAVAFSPGGEEVVSADVGGTVCRWETAKGTEVHRFGLDLQENVVPGFVPWNRPMALSPGGELLAAEIDLSRSKYCLYETASGRALHELAGPRGSAHSTLAFSLNGKQLAAAGEEKAIHVWDARSGKEIRRLTMREKGTPLRFGAGRIALSGDGRLLAVANHYKGPNRMLTGKVYVWEVGSGKEVCCIPLGDAPFQGLALSPDGRVLATAGIGGIGLWDTTKGQKLRRLEGPVGSDTCLSFAPDGRVLAMGVLHRRGSAEIGPPDLRLGADYGADPLPTQGP